MVRNFLEESTVYSTLRKYCSFMPVPIFIHITKEEEEQKEEQKTEENSNVIHVSPEEAENITSAEDAKKITRGKKGRRPQTIK